MFAVAAAVQAIAPEAPATVRAASLQLLRKLVANVLLHPQDTKYRSPGAEGTVRDPRTRVFLPIA